MKIKLISSFFLSIILIILCSFTYADDYIEEEDTLNSTATQETATAVVNVPKINARHAVVLDRSSCKVLYGKSETEKCKMASTTKIMTATIVLENTPNLKEKVKISKRAASIGGSRLGLSTNDEITVENLLYGLMLRSGNDSAIALAEHIGGNVENFIKMMNGKAVELGLTSTHFITPHGLDDDNHYTTAYELALLTNYALNNPTFKKIVGTKNYTIYINNKPKNLNNTNELLSTMGGVYGVKTGFTNGANRCLVTACKQSSLDIICVVLGCDTKKNRTQDSANLINYTLTNFTTINIKNLILQNFEDFRKNNASLFYINKAYSNYLDLSIDIDSLPYEIMAVKKEEKNNIKLNYNVNYNLESPIFPNTCIGNLDVLQQDSLQFSIPISNKNNIEKKSIIFYLKSFFYNYNSSINNII